MKVRKSWSSNGSLTRCLQARHVDFGGGKTEGVVNRESSMSSEPIRASKQCSSRILCDSGEVNRIDVDSGCQDLSRISKVHVS